MEDGQSQEEITELPELLVLRPPGVFEVYEKQFSERFRLLKAWEFPVPTDRFLSSHASSVQALLTSGVTPITADIFHLLPSLRFIFTTSVGLDHLDLQVIRRRGIAVANAPRIFSEDVADMAVVLLIDVLRKITASNRYVRARLWPVRGDYPLGSKLGGKQVGIVGLGNIGLEVAKRLEAFGCTISYNSTKRKPSVTYPFHPNVCELAAKCNILVICCALTDETRYMINKEVLLALGKDGVIINIARGAVIDEKELVQALIRGDIAGAGLDVFENEPEVPGELFELDNVVLQPHRAVYTEESFRDLFELICGNLEAFFSNKPLHSPAGDEWMD